MQFVIAIVALLVGAAFCFGGFKFFLLLLPLWGFVVGFTVGTDAITAIWKDHHLERLELQPLSLAETTKLVEHVLDGPVDSFSAQRLWQYTQGNALYLRHLLDNEVIAGRMTQRSGMWLWDGHPELSPTLAGLDESFTGPRFPGLGVNVQDLFEDVPIERPVLLAPPGGHGSPTGS